MAARKSDRICESCEKDDLQNGCCVDKENVDDGLCRELCSPSSDLQENRRMIRKKDIVPILFLYLCFTSICPAYPCGEDPLRKLYTYAEATGQDPDSVLSNIRFQDIARYRYIIQQHKTYDECVIRVETGSFKRSSAHPNPSKAGSMLRFLDPKISSRPQSDSLPQEKRRPFYFLPLVSRRALIHPNIWHRFLPKLYISGRTHFPFKRVMGVRRNRVRRIFPYVKGFRIHK